MIQVFYAWRVYVLSPKRRFFAIIPVIIVLVSQGYLSAVAEADIYQVSLLAFVAMLWESIIVRRAYSIGADGVFNLCVYARRSHSVLHWRSLPCLPP